MIRAVGTPVLLAVATFTALLVSRPPPPIPPAPPKGGGQRVVEVPPPRASAPAPVELPRADPFRAFEERAERKGGAVARSVLKLSGIYKKGSELRGLINGRLYRVGDQVEEAGKVKEIDEHRNRVIIAVEAGQDVILTMEEQG